MRASKMSLPSPYGMVTKLDTENHNSGCRLTEPVLVTSSVP